MENSSSTAPSVNEITPLLADTTDTCTLGKCHNKFKKHITFSAMWIAYTTVNGAFSILTPFFPLKAAEFGVGSFIVGIIMGVSPLCVVVLSPVFGYLAFEIGVKFMLMAGLFLVGGSNFLLGFVDKMSSSLEFITFSVSMEVVEGIGSAGIFTASFTIATTLYPTKTGFIMGVLELGAAIGLFIGPLVGGVLYEFCGFLNTFVCAGSLVLLFVPILQIIMPKHLIPDGNKQHLSLQTVARLLINFPFILLALCVVLIMAATAFFGPVFSPFLSSQFHLSELAIGCIFFLSSLSYLLTSLTAGYFTDIIGPRYIIIGGLLTASVPFFFIGPAVFILNKSYLWLTCLSFGITGVGMGIAYIPVFSDMLQVARRIDPHTSPELMSGIISGISSASCSLGEFGGPIIGGGLSQVLSFQTSSALLGMVFVAQALLLLGVTLIDRFLPYQRRSFKIILKV